MRAPGAPVQPQGCCKALSALPTPARRPRCGAPGGGGGRAARRARCSALAGVGSPPQLLYVLDAAAGHAKDGHPECPGRIDAIRAALAAGSLLGGQHFRTAAGASPGAGAQPRELADAAVARWRGAAARRALEAVHPAAYLDRLGSICSGLSAPAMVDESTYIAPGSFDASLEAAAKVLACLEAVLAGSSSAGSSGGGSPSSGSSGAGSSSGGSPSSPISSSSGSPISSGGGTTGFCLVRPPGHHVLANRPMGFGLLNLVSTAVAHALTRPGIARVLVLDWDVHHGNGTEAIFESNPDVMYLSTHQQGLWPYTGKASYVGSGAGAGATINLPLPGGAGDATMRLAWEGVVAPAAARFQPDLLIVSAGYDAHWCDPLASMQLTSATYHWLAAEAQALAARHCAGRCLFVLEGGYHLPSLGEAVAESFRGLLGAPPASPPPAQLTAGRLLSEEPLAKVEAAVAEARRRHGLG